jgi:hypothetical protein
VAVAVAIVEAVLVLVGVVLFVFVVEVFVVGQDQANGLYDADDFQGSQPGNKSFAGMAKYSFVLTRNESSPQRQDAIGLDDSIMNFLVGRSKLSEGNLYGHTVHVMKNPAMDVSIRRI